MKPQHILPALVVAGAATFGTASNAHASIPDTYSGSASPAVVQSLQTDMSIQEADGRFMYTPSRGNSLSQIVRDVGQTFGDTNPLIMPSPTTEPYQSIVAANPSIPNIQSIREGEPIDITPVVTYFAQRNQEPVLERPATEMQIPVAPSFKVLEPCVSDFAVYTHPKPVHPGAQSYVTTRVNTQYTPPEGSFLFIDRDNDREFTEETDVTVPLMQTGSHLLVRGIFTLPEREIFSAFLHNSATGKNELAAALMYTHIDAEPPQKDHPARMKREPSTVDWGMLSSSLVQKRISGSHLPIHGDLAEGGHMYAEIDGVPGFSDGDQHISVRQHEVSLADRMNTPRLRDIPSGDYLGVNHTLLLPESMRREPGQHSIPIYLTQEGSDDQLVSTITFSMPSVDDDRVWKGAELKRQDHRFTGEVDLAANTITFPEQSFDFRSEFSPASFDGLERCMDLNKNRNCDEGEPRIQLEATQKDRWGRSWTLTAPSQTLDLDKYPQLVELGERGRSFYVTVSRTDHDYLVSAGAVKGIPRREEPVRIAPPQPEPSGWDWLSNLWS